MDFLIAVGLFIGGVWHWAVAAWRDLAAWFGLGGLLLLVMWLALYCRRLSNRCDVIETHWRWLAKRVDERDALINANLLELIEKTRERSESGLAALWQRVDRHDESL